VIVKRLADFYLQEWKNGIRRKPLMVRGARQVGKTFSVRRLGQSFEDYLEVNFEQTPKVAAIFESDLNPHRITRDLSIFMKHPIIPGKTLVFLDEIQQQPKALIALRYFYEQMPELHVVAAGSLLDFTIEQVGIPVGRVASLYMYPVSYLEFLLAKGEELLLAEICQHGPEAPLSSIIHDKALSLLSEYLAIGGLPEAVQCWVETNDWRECLKIHRELLDTYIQDFDKYAKKFQIKYLERIFPSIARQLGKEFKYTEIEGDFRKRDLSPALDLLFTAGIGHRVLSSSGQSVPLGAQADPHRFKVINLDIALAQTQLGLDMGPWFLEPTQTIVNKGALVESFVGQELLAYAPSEGRADLYCWLRHAKGSQAEIDYLIPKEGQIIPIEVKSGPGTSLKSMHIFLKSHTDTPYGIRLSIHNYSIHEKIHTYPLYAIIKAIGQSSALDIFSRIAS
jgi:predicted AAA+ superfamily ATPase